jgi:hypothetical protein
VAGLVALNLMDTSDTFTIATNANAANATATSGVDGTVNLNGLQVVAPNGALANPAYSFTGAQNTGFYRSGTSILIATAGAERAGFNIISAGDLIIGSIGTFGISAGLPSSGGDVAIARAGIGTMTVTDGSVGVGRLWVGGDTVGGIGLSTAMMAGWGSP